MISVVIPTLNAEAGLRRALPSLLAANATGLIREVIVSDGGSADNTVAIAAAAGARVLTGPKSRGAQLARGAAAARGDWLLFLHADTALSPDWAVGAQQHMATAHDRVAAVFRLRFDDHGVAPEIVARAANLRTQIFKMPYGDQGLLMSAAHYNRIGGFKPMALFEDVDMVRRIVETGGRRSLVLMRATVRTSAERYIADGYFSRVFRNARCVRMYLSGAPVPRILEVYHGRSGANQKTAYGDGEAAVDGPGQNPPQP